MPTTKTFNYTGSVQTFRVPLGVTSIVIDAYGAMGGDMGTARQGRAGGTLAVTPGETLYVYVGGPGSAYRSGGIMAGGFNGGGRGGTGTTFPGFDGNGGGGASDVRQGGTAAANRKIVAAGSGGRTGPGTSGGAGGGTTGNGGSVGGAGGGGGGTPSAGGAYGNGGGGGGTAGSFGLGGIGGQNLTAAKSGGGGGGGGYYGGGGGSVDAGTGNNAGGGGGGSSYTGGVTGGTTTTGYPAASGIYGQVIFTYNTIPNLATQSSPTAGAYTDQTAATVLSWVFSDNDPGDVQSAADIRYRPVGAGSWTTVAPAVTGTGSSYSITAATLTAGSQYEWQVQTYDSTSAASGWSNSGLFTPVAPPSAPTITSPANGSNITADPTTYTWTPSGTQNGYQLQVCGDTAGTINTAVVYYDTGTVSSTTASGLADVTPPGAGVTVHVRVRTFTYAGVWSPWTERGAQLINLNAPGVPTVVLAQDLTFGRISIAITNPSTPNVTVTNTIYRTVGNAAETLWQANVAPNVTVYDGLVPFGYTVRYRVVAFSAAGGQTSST